ncbi:unnamed protein product, partial [Didymodactylos carnosus]
LGEIRRDDGCLDFSGGVHEVGKDDKIIVYPCHGMKGNQHWAYKENGHIFHQVSSLCLALSTDNKHIQMEKCDESNLRLKCFLFQDKMSLDDDLTTIYKQQYFTTQLPSTFLAWNLNNNKNHDDFMKKILLLQRLIRRHYIRKQFDHVQDEYLKTLNDIENVFVSSFPSYMKPKDDITSNHTSKNEVIIKPIPMISSIIQKTTITKELPPVETVTSIVCPISSLSGKIVNNRHQQLESPVVRNEETKHTGIDQHDSIDFENQLNDMDDTKRLTRNELLRKRESLAIELVWIEQAIKSRKDYLKLKTRYTSVNS